MPGKTWEKQLTPQGYMIMSRTIAITIRTRVKPSNTMASGAMLKPTVKTGMDDLAGGG